MKQEAISPPLRTCWLHGMGVNNNTSTHFILQLQGRHDLQRGYTLMWSMEDMNTTQQNNPGKEYASRMSKLVVFFWSKILAALMQRKNWLRCGRMTALVIPISSITMCMSPCHCDLNVISVSMSPILQQI